MGGVPVRPIGSRAIQGQAPRCGFSEFELIAPRRAAGSSRFGSVRAGVCLICLTLRVKRRCLYILL